MVPPDVIDPRLLVVLASFLVMDVFLERGRSGGVSQDSIEAAELMFLEPIDDVLVAGNFP
jgi:hypothetical protein